MRFREIIVDKRFSMLAERTHLINENRWTINNENTQLSERQKSQLVRLIINRS